MANHDSRQVPIAEAMRLAIDHHQAGRLQQAEAVYRAVLESEPDHAGALYNLGLIALQNGRAVQAVPMLKAAVQRDPDNAAFWMNYAVALAACGEPRAARQVLLQARERGHGGEALSGLLAQVEKMAKSSGPTVIETIGAGEASRAPNIGALLRLYGHGRYAEVEAAARPLLDAFPDSAPLARLLGSALLAQNKFEAAREALGRAAESIPDDAVIHDLHGLALRRLRRNEQARQAFERSLAVEPDRLETLLNASANALTLGDASEARTYAERAVALRPDHVDALRVLADAAAAEGANEEAVELYRRALAVDPNAVDLYVNLGDALTNLSRPDEATREIERALALRPDYAPAELSLGRALYELGETAAARSRFRRASDLAPEMPEAHTAYLFCLTHDETVAADEVFAEHRRVGALIEAPHRPGWRAHDNDRDPERLLRLGFVSGDLRDHAVAYLIEPVLRALRGGPRLVAYANQPREDAVSGRLRALFDEWVRVERLDDEALAERIRADRIDILFDLSGHTTRNRLPVFARRPAPIQASWIGYPGTTGLTAIDYRFVRRNDASDGAMDRHFVEKLVSFRYRGFQPEASAPAVNRLPALDGAPLVFGSFNRPGKISAATVELWSAVLRALPGSTMLIAAVDEPRTQERLTAQFGAAGVAVERLRFHRRLPLADYLTLHHEVDIALDTFPYTGGTTTSHALWMGVPVLTLLGERLQQTQAASILAMLGMSDWAVASEQAFVDKACAAAADLEALDRLRRQLRPKMASTFQGAEAEVRRELDAALRTMWRRWCSGQPPESFAVSG